MRAPVEHIPGSNQHPTTLGRLRIVLADPSSFTPEYDHELASSLARAGADVELATSRFRFGETIAPEGYRRNELFYPLSSRLFRRSRLRLPLKAIEHPLGLARLHRRPADVVHVQWLAAPGIDARLLRSRAPLVFTAHDLLPRRTAGKVELWRRLLERFDRVVVHSERGRETLAGIGAVRDRLRVIPHPVFPSDPPRRDDGRTVLALGMIRPYKGLGDAIEAIKRTDDARLLVAGEPLEPVDGYRAAAGNRAEWRLRYLAADEVDAALGESTLAVFPYRPEIDQSGALLRALGAGVPVVAYDVAGLAEPVRRFDAGRVVPAGDIDGLAEAITQLTGDPGALAAAREGAERARAELTWDAAAAAHLELYRELLP